MAIINVKRNDVGVKFADILKSAGVVIDLTGATVKFIMRNATKTVSQSATVVSAGAGTVSYVTVANDLDTAGTFEQEWEVYFSGTGKRYTVPSDGYNTVNVLDDLG